MGIWDRLPAGCGAVCGVGEGGVQVARDEIAPRVNTRGDHHLHDVVVLEPVWHVGVCRTCLIRYALTVGLRTVESIKFR